MKLAKRKKENLKKKWYKNSKLKKKIGGSIYKWS